MNNLPLILYHGNCADGFASFWIAQKALGEVEGIAVNYGQEAPDVTGRNVYILDFSYKREVMLDMISKSSSLVLLDHHKTAEKELIDLLDLVITSQQKKSTYIKFDMNKSGAKLTWEYFRPNTPAPWIVNYIEDRDLWKWELPKSKEINAALRSYPMTIESWDTIYKIYFSHTNDKDYPSLLFYLRDLVNDGKAILRSQSQIVYEHVQNAIEIELSGYKVLTVNATVLQSEIAGTLAKDRPFGTCYFIRSDGKKIWSLRSTPQGIDVSEVAKKFGGGGHKHAAGYQE